MELSFMGEDGDAIMRTVLCCRNNTDKVYIRAIHDADKPVCAYRYRMVRPNGLIE